MDEADKRTDPNPFDGFCELVLEAEEPSTLADFYSAVGLPRLDAEDDRIWLAAGRKSRLGIWDPGAKEHGDRGGRHVHFALSVSPGGIDDAAARLRELGTDVEGPIEHDGGDRSIYFDDPAGNRVELWDFFERREGAVEGVEALAEDPDARVSDPGA